MKMRNDRIDNLDRRIINILSENPRKPVKRIAQETKASRPTITKRIEKLFGRGLIAVNVGLNLGRLGYRTAYIGLEVKGMEERQKTIEALKMCPRVLTILQPSGETNLNVYGYGENNTTLESLIESLRDLSNVRIVYVQYSEPPIYPENVCVKLYPEKAEVAPCGKRCAQCESFKSSRCVGCPATTAYSGLL